MNERDIAEGQSARDWYFNRFGVDETQPVQEVTDPKPEHNVAARKLNLSVEAINRAKDAQLYTNKRHLTESLAYRLANPYVPLENISRYSNLPLESLREDLQSAYEAFQWAANVVGVGDGMQKKFNGQSNP